MVDKKLMIKFIQENNAIDGLYHDIAPSEYNAYKTFLEYSKVEIDFLQVFVEEIAGAQIRDQAGMNVIVGNHIAPKGGSHIKTALKNILVGINTSIKSSYSAHHEYETLHPFMDGNGRSGRLLWLWTLQKKYGYKNITPTLERGFLHTWYYQSLQYGR